MRPVRLTQRFRHQRFQRQALQCALPVTEHAFGLRIGQHYGAFPVHRDHRVGCDVEPHAQHHEADGGEILLVHPCPCLETRAEKRYPAPRTDLISSGLAGSDSTLRRNRPICTSMARSNGPALRPWMCSIKSSRDSTRLGCSTSTRNSSYSPVVRAIVSPLVVRRVRDCGMRRKSPNCSATWLAASAGTALGAARRSTLRTRASNSRRSKGLVT